MSGKHVFQKGNIPANKGIKMSESAIQQRAAKARQSLLNKGVPHPLYKPIGSERLDKDGYLEVRVSGPIKWKKKHHIIWEETFGAIPTGHLVKFKDGNRHNLDPSNLFLASRQENMQANSFHNYPKEIENLIQLRGVLNRQINENNQRSKNSFT